MGMYTELVLKCRIKEDAPDEVKAVVSHLFCSADAPEVLPPHPLLHWWDEQLLSPS